MYIIYLHINNLHHVSQKWGSLWGTIIINPQNCRSCSRLDPAVDLRSQPRVRLGAQEAARPAVDSPNENEELSHKNSGEITTRMGAEPMTFHEFCCVIPCNSM